jgi:macrolide transport system ATP-binding/permease protein
MLGIVIGLTALVATVGLSRTASNRIITQFDELAATEIVVTVKAGPASTQPNALPWDAPTRLLRLNGVAAVGTLSAVNVGSTLVSSSPVTDPRGQTDFKLSVQAASPGLFTAVRAELAAGRFPDLGHSNRADRVAVLGPGAALRLGIVGVEQLPAITIGDNLYLVIGILRGVGRQPDLLGSVIIPEGTARRDFGLVRPGSVIVETRIGAMSLIARQIPLALRPDNPTVLQVVYPPEPQRVRDAVQSDLNVLFAPLASATLRSCRSSSGSARSACADLSGQPVDTLLPSSYSRVALWASSGVSLAPVSEF